jgi:hypothetical protein
MAAKQGLAPTCDIVSRTETIAPSCARCGSISEPARPANHLPGFLLMFSRPPNSGTPRDRGGNFPISKLDQPDRTFGLNRLQFLQALFGGYFELRKAFIMVQSEAPAGKKVNTRHFPTIEALAKEVFPTRHQVFFGVCPRETVRPGPDGIAYCTSLWTVVNKLSEDERKRGDYYPDEQRVARAVRAFPLRPSIIVESSSFLHLYWLLTRPAKIGRASQLEEILDRIHKYFDGSKPVNMDAMLSLPDTEVIDVLGAVRPCKVKFISTAFSYSIAEMLDGLALVDRTRREAGQQGRTLVEE